MVQQHYVGRRAQYFEQIQMESVTILFAGEAPYKSADEQYKFTPNRNFYYLTGIDAPKLIFMGIKTDSKIEEYIFIERENPQLARWIGATVTAEEVTQKSGIQTTYYLDEFTSVLSRVFDRRKFKICYLDLERQQWGGSESVALVFAQQLQKQYPAVKIENAWEVIAKLRMVKSDAEIDEIRKAISVTKQGIEVMVRALLPGKTENEIEAYFDFTLKQAGVSDFAFPTICATGKNATILHYNKNNDQLGREDLILFDLGAQVNYYNADISRTFPVNGKFTKRQQIIYEIVLSAMKAVEQATKPGVTLQALNDVAIEVLANGCLNIGLIDNIEQIHDYYIHSIGHHLGLDTHDVALQHVPLEAGMVITNEPGLYIEEEGIGIRIEDDLLVTANGCENLSKDIIKTVTDIEAFFKK
ncbi:MAG: aminopeptidase P family protein [Culicoidibacterales bacterium]